MFSFAGGTRLGSENAKKSTPSANGSDNGTGGCGTGLSYPICMVISPTEFHIILISYGLDEYLRVTIGLPAENREFIAELENVLQPL